MAIAYDGSVLVSNVAGPWSTPFEWGTGRGNADHPIISLFRQLGYDELYCRQPSVRKVVSKLSGLQTMVPLKVYRTSSSGERSEAPRSPYGRLLADPCPSLMNAYDWRRWMSGIHLLYGEAVAVKVRDGLGRPVELPPVHPLRLRYGKEEGRAWKVADRRRLTEHEADTGLFWWFRLDDGATEFQIARRDLVIWREFNPKSTARGTSKLEPLRDSLEDDKAARVAMEAIWKHGGKPAFVLTAPDDFKLGHPAIVQAIATDFQAAHGGVTKWQKPLVLDGGMDVKELRTDKNLEYLGLRRLTDVEVAATYDLTGPAVHILDHANFASVVELFRDVFRSTMPPLMQSFEAALDHDLRDGRHGRGDVDPDFGSFFHAEHLLDGVMKGNPEQRHESYARQIQTGQITPNEARRLENRPPVDGGDVLFINGAIVPIDLAGQRTAAFTEGSGVSVDGGGEDNPALPAVDGDAGLSVEEFATVMGRLGRLEALDALDFDRLTAGLSNNAVALLRATVGECKRSGGTPVELRQMIKERNR